MNTTILKYAYSTGENRVDNDNLSQIFPELNIERLEKKVGIKSRYRSTVSTYENALKSVSNLGLSAEDIKSIDYIIYCTQHETSNIPNDSFLLHEYFKFSETTETLYTNLGCSAYPTLLYYAFALTKKEKSRVLIVTTEKYSSSINANDGINNYLFSDIATSIVFEIEGPRPKYKSGTESSGIRHLCIPAKIPPVVKEKSQHFYMNGQAVFSFSQSAVVQLNEDLSITEDMIVIPHQANEFMIKSMTNKINSKNIIINFHEFGNSVSSTIPLAIITMIEKGEFVNGKYALLGFGVGLAYSGIVINLYNGSI